MLNFGLLGEQAHMDTIGYLFFILITLVFVFTAMKLMTGSFSSDIRNVILSSLLGGVFIILALFWQNILYTNPVTMKKALEELIISK